MNPQEDEMQNTSNLLFLMIYLLRGIKRERLGRGSLWSLEENCICVRVHDFENWTTSTFSFQNPDLKIECTYNIFDSEVYFILQAFHESLAITVSQS